LRLELISKDSEAEVTAVIVCRWCAILSSRDKTSSEEIKGALRIIAKTLHALNMLQACTRCNFTVQLTLLLEQPTHPPPDDVCLQHSSSKLFRLWTIMLLVVNSIEAAAGLKVAVSHPGWHITAP
jgi:hypothetical protein